jgi:hypothetical protein
MLQLSSYQRIRRYLSADDLTSSTFAALTDTIHAEREITNWITSISKQIEKWLEDCCYKSTRIW